MSDKEVLVVASKLKRFIKDEAGFNTSSTVMEALSEQIRVICKSAIENARNEGRKTVMDRDIPGAQAS